MDAVIDITDSKNSFFHSEIRRGLQSGRYLPGDRIDPGVLAEENKTSVTPVKNALFRLAGQGMLVEQVRVGLFVPIPTEADLRALYYGMRLMLSNALVAGFPSNLRWKVDQVEIMSPEEDLVKRTWQLFVAIGRATGQPFIYESIRHLSDRLAPIRRAKQGWIEDSFEELSELNRLWNSREAPKLEAAIRTYHRRRTDLVPEIVAMLNERPR